MPEYIKDTEYSRDTPRNMGKTLGSFLWHR